MDRGLNKQESSVNNQFIYIVGGGTFALKIAKILSDNDIHFEFIDDIQPGSLCNRTVYRTNQIPNKNHVFLVAISMPKYAQNARTKLITNGVLDSHILLLKYESATNVLQQMFKLNTAFTLNLLQKKLVDFPTFERDYFTNSTVTPHNKKLPNLGFYFIGQGGGFRGHIVDLPDALRPHGNVRIFSDTEDSHHGKRFDYSIMGEESMLANEWPDLVINPHFFECSPKHIPKLTMMHMVYDFLLFKDLVARVMAQPDIHYLFIPSMASMLLHKEIYRQYGLTNQVVLIPGGYPKLDKNVIQFKAESAKFKANSILYAPTLSALVAAKETKFTYSILEAVDFIPKLLNDFPDKEIIFRPHPDDLIVIEQGITTKRAQAFRVLLALCDTHPRCHLDKSKNYINVFAKAEVIISDTSSVAFSFAVTTGRPVIFYSANQQQLLEELPDIAYIKDRQKIGYCIDNYEDLSLTLRNCFTKTRVINKCDFRQSIVFNKGTSQQYLVDNLQYLLSGDKHPDWWYLNEIT